MAYFKIGNVDYSNYVSGLKVTTNHNYNAQTNAAGNTVVDYINSKRIIDVNIIPLDDAAMIKLQSDIEAFNMPISFRNPQTGALEENVEVIIPVNGIEYYNLAGAGRMYKAFALQFIEL